MLTRRTFVLCSAGAVAAAPRLTSRQRVDLALKGAEPDRPPFSFWYHFGVEKEGPKKHAEATLAFHRKFRTDLVKVMSDFPFPKPAGEWYRVKLLENPFAPQIQALELIRDGLGGQAHFVETIFNPWNVATKLSSKEEVLRMKTEKPQVLLDALEAIAKSEAAHAKRALSAGASGIFLAIDNAQQGYLTEQEYSKFSEPFDRMVLAAASGAPLNSLHLHGDKVYLARFWKGWPATVINYSVHGTGVPLAEARKHFDGVLMGGMDERNIAEINHVKAKRWWLPAQEAAGKKFILAPGCSVPNDTRDEDLLIITKMFGAQ